MRMHIYAEIRSCFDVVKVELHKRDLEGVGHGLHQGGGGGSDGAKHASHPGLHQVTQRLAPLEAIICRVPGPCGLNWCDSLSNAAWLLDMG